MSDSALDVYTFGIHERQGVAVLTLSTETFSCAVAEGDCVSGEPLSVVALGQTCKESQAFMSSLASLSERV